MKKLSLLIAFLLSVAAWAKTPLAAELQCRMIEPDRAEVTIIVSGRQGRPEIAFADFPGGHWLTDQRSVRNSVRSSFVNGRGSTVYSYICTVPLVLTQPDAVTIPSVVITLDGERTQTEPFPMPEREARRQKAKKSNPGGADLSALTATLSFAGGVSHFVGEKVPFTLEIAVPVPARLNGISTSGIQGLNFDQAKSAGREPMRRGDVTIYRIDGSLALSRSGTFPTDLPLQLSLFVPEIRRRDAFDDFFFGGLRGREEVREVRCRCEDKELCIVPLPPPPEGTYDLSLAGIWQLHAQFSPENNVKSGEAMTLVITGQGDRPASALRAPKLADGKFRIYPPEVKKQGNRFRIEYALIPLMPGEAKLDFPFAVFDPSAGKYQIFHARSELTVSPGAEGAHPAPEVHRPAGGSGRSAAPAAVAGTPSASARSDFFYPHSDGRRLVKFPLWKNVAPSIAVWLAIALVVAAVAWAWSKRRRLGGVWQKRAQKHRLHQLLKHADVNTLASQLPDVIAAMLQLPPGATVAEITAKVDDPVVREALEQCVQNGFMPGCSAWTPDRKTRAQLWKHLKKMLILIAVCLPLATMADHALFDAGRFAEAAKQYEAKYDPRHADVDLLYNAACAHFHAGNLAAAHLALRRAHLLAPRDGEIAARLAKVEEELQLPGRENGTAWNFDHAISYLRPDEWLLVAGIVLAVWIALCGFYGLLHLKWRWSIGAIAVVSCLLCLGAYQREKSQLYSPRQAMTVAETPLRTLPSASSGRTAASLPAGSDLRILEAHGKWFLVETSSGRGWVAAPDVEKIFPDGV